MDVGDGETKEIPIHELFRFQRETDTSVEGSISCVPEIATRSLEDLQEEIKLQLEAAYAWKRCCANLSAFAGGLGPK